MSNRKPAGLDFGTFADIKTPKVTKTVPEKKAIQAAENEGFTSRQPLAKKIDGRTLRNSPRKTQLNINVQETTKNRFWTLAKETDLIRGDDLLIALMDNYEQTKNQVTKHRPPAPETL